MRDDFRRAFINAGFLIAGFLIGALVYGYLDGSPYQPWVSWTLMAIGGLVCARVAMR